MKVVFVHFGRENMGIEYLSAALRRDGHEVALVHDPGLFSTEDNVFHSPFLEKIFRTENIADRIVSKKPDLVAFSAYTTTYRRLLAIAEDLKKRSSVPVIFGGMHPTLVPERVISSPFIDYVHIGEGEATFPAFVASLSDGRSLEDTNNIFYKRNGSILRTPLFAPIKDLDSIPFPDKELFAGSVRYKDDYMILASRGCHNSCSYCCESFLNRLYGNGYFRRRSVTSVIDELCFMKERYNFREVMFFDSILFTDKKWLKEMLSLYRRKVGVPFRCTGHVDLLDCETAGLLKDAGCYTIDFGVQSFNQGFRKEALNRREDNAQIRKAFDVCDGMRLRYDVDLMFGLPESSVEDYRLPLSFMQDNKYLNRLKCYNLSFYPRLSITQNARERGLLNDKNIEDIEEGRIGDWFHVDSIKEPAQKRQKEAFQKLYKLYPAMPGFLRRFVAKRDLHRAFRFIPYGLVIFVQFLIGLFKRDYRFRIYINNYLHHTRMRFSSSKGKR